jgi:Lon protease-like protein
MPQALHIFEPRYREMIGECLAGGRPFGVVRSKEEGVAEIGCTAEITEVTKKHEDGRMDITAEGRQRFEIVQLNTERAFLQAEVMYFDDEGEDAPPDRRTRAVELQSELLRVGGAEAEPPEADTPQLSFHLAGVLPLDLDFKQTLLAMRSEGDRLSAVIEYYEALLPRLKRAMKTRQKAGGNGHVA